MKNKILAILILFGISINSQTTFSRYEIPKEEAALCLDLENHVKKFSNYIQRNKRLDSIAKIRAKYFVSVLEETSRIKKMSLYTILGSDGSENKIPRGSKGHDRYFGNSEFFSEPLDYTYPIWNPRIKSENIKVNGEIFQISCGRFFRDSPNLDTQVMKRYLEKYKYEYGNKYLINNYLKSYDHSNVIKKYGKGEYGTYTLILLSKRWDNLENLWVYEPLIFNIVIFSEPI